MDHNDPGVTRPTGMFVNAARVSIDVSANPNQTKQAISSPPRADMKQKQAEKQAQKAKELQQRIDAQAAELQKQADDKKAQEIAMRLKGSIGPKTTGSMKKMKLPLV